MVVRCRKLWNSLMALIMWHGKILALAMAEMRYALKWSMAVGPLPMSEVGSNKMFLFALQQELENK